MKNCFALTFLAGLITATAASTGAADCEDAGGDPADAEAIRAQRLAFNQAIAEKNADLIENILDEDVILVTGTDSDLFGDRDAQVAIWRDDFAKDDRAIYVRTPGCLRVSGVAPVALETGTWHGETVSDARVFAAGSYAAKWRKVERQWRLEAEIFSTETCGGRFCPAEPDKND